MYMQFYIFRESSYVDSGYCDTESIVNSYEDLDNLHSTREVDGWAG